MPIPPLTLFTLEAEERVNMELNKNFEFEIFLI